jgi:hypothetical protein
MRLALVLVTLFALACGADTYDSQGTNRAVGTDAEVSVSDDPSGNHRIEIEVRHLPPPGRIASGHTHFVAWSIPDGGVPQHIGTLDYDEDDRVGTLETLTPFNVFQVRVTAEKERLPRSPSEHVVVRQSVEHD